MARSRTLAFLFLGLACGISSPATAASSFSQLWSLPGWKYVMEIGNTDGDPQTELLFSNKVDGHYAIVDGLTGAIATEFPGFTEATSGLSNVDVDGDGRLELIFWRPDAPLVTGYDWVAGTYVTLFSHTDPISSYGLINLRNATTFDGLEVSGTDIRVRDMSGTVLFRASTAIPGWSGDAPSPVPFDIDADGVLELGVVEHTFTPTAKVSYFNYSGGFTPAWTVDGWQILGGVQTDGDPQIELVMTKQLFGHYALFDGVSGAVEQEFPEFTFQQIAQFNAFDTDGDGRSEVFLWRNEDLPTTRLFRAYRWSAGTYTQMFSHADQVDHLSLGHFRSPTAYDLLETNNSPNPAEIRIRDLAGNVVFRASTQIPGWSSADLYMSEEDADGDGLQDLVIQNVNTLSFVRWSGASFVRPWSTSAWTLKTSLNADGDAPPELVVVNTADQHFALLNSQTGAVKHEFPAFTDNNSYLQTFDTDADGQLELAFVRFDFAPPPLFTMYDWKPSGYATLFSHTDVLEGMGNAHLRAPDSFELLEFGPNDLRLRDLAGVVLFRASTDLVGWTGTNRDMMVMDVNGDGIQELLAIDDGSVRLVRFTGTTSVLDPGAHAFHLLASAPNPFRTDMAFRFSTPSAGNVGIRVFDASGRLVRRLDRSANAGLNEVHWDGLDDGGRTVPSGLLFYEVMAGGKRQTGRMVRLGN